MDSSQRSGTHASNFHSSRAPHEVCMDHHRALYTVRCPKPSPSAPPASQERQKLSSAWDAWFPPPPPEEDQHSSLFEEHLMDREDFDKPSPSFEASYDRTYPCARTQRFWTRQPLPREGYSQKQIKREISPESLLLQQQLKFAGLGILMQVTFRITPQRVEGSRVFDTFPLRYLLHILLWHY